MKVEQLMSMDMEPEGLIMSMTPTNENTVPFYNGVSMGEILNWMHMRNKELEAERDDWERIASERHRLHYDEREACAMECLSEGIKIQQSINRITMDSELVDTLLNCIEQCNANAAAIRKRGT